MLCFWPGHLLIYTNLNMKSSESQSQKVVIGKSPDSPRLVQRKSDKQGPDIRPARMNGSDGPLAMTYQTVKTATGKREQSPARSGLKQTSFTKFPPLKKNADEVAEPELFQKASEKENDNGTNVGTGVRVNLQIQFQKKKLDKKKALLMNTVNSVLLMRYKQYKEFLDAVNISNNLRILNQKQQMKPYVLYVGKGNNSTLIKNVMKNRPWWVITEDKNDPTINMVWTQLRQNEVLADYKSMKTEENLEDLTYELDEAAGDVENTPGTQPAGDESEGESKNFKNRTFSRSQSVNHKDALSSSIRTQKRNSSKGKQRQIVSSKIIISKDIKETVELDKQKVNVIAVSNKRQLMNPKMWVNYQNLRRIFSQKDMKNLKHISALQEDGGVRPVKRNKMRYYENCSNFKIHNHLENNWNLSNKKALFFNVKSYYEAKKINPWDYIPVTFHIEDLNSKQFSKFLQYYNQKQQQINNQFKKPQQGAIKPRVKRRNVWLVKPGQNTNRGAGITVTESLQQITALIENQKIDYMGRPRTHILQQYIMPFLYNKRKFDIRTYICLTSANGISKGYWFQEGYIRTACKQFNFKNLSNKMIHLTNDAVQKKCEEYGKYEPGNKISFADFQRYLDSQEPKYKFWSSAYPEMKKLATDAIKSVYTKIDPLKKEFSFEIFGLDFMIDENFKMYLIEANTNPCLQLSSPLLGRVIPSMIENAFRIAVDPIFMPPSQACLASMKRPIIPQSMFENNKFELVFDEVEEGKELRALLTNVPSIQIFDIEEEEEQENEQVEKSNLKLYEQALA